MDYGVFTDWGLVMPYDDTDLGQNCLRLMAPHYIDVIMGAIAFKITSLTIVYSIVQSDADQRKHQSSASLAFVRGIRRGPVNSPHKGPVTRKMFPFDDVIMIFCVSFAQRCTFYQLTVAYWRHMAAQICVNIGSCNGLLADRTKSLPEPMMTSRQWCSLTFTRERFQNECLRCQSAYWVWKLHISNYCQICQGTMS